MPAPGRHEKWTERLRLLQFTTFEDNEFEFVPGVNAFVGENGTGKTHVMKAIYAMLFVQARQARSIDETIAQLFQVTDPADVINLRAPAGATALVTGVYGGEEWSYGVQRTSGPTTVVASRLTQTERPVFIPAIDMMGHTRGFTEAYADVRLDFDLTCSDIVNLLRLESRRPEPQNGAVGALADVLAGTLERDDAGRFYLTTGLGRLPMPMVAEGMRRIATLVQLAANGWLKSGATLFWDEPEVNLNPVLMDEVVRAILALARSGVQVFLATHSYLILREIEVQATGEDRFRYFALEKIDGGVRARPAERYLEIAPNPIERQYAELYDRAIQKELDAAEGHR